MDRPRTRDDPSCSRYAAQSPYVPTRPIRTSNIAPSLLQPFSVTGGCDFPVAPSSDSPRGQLFDLRSPWTLMRDVKLP